jgi:cyclic-di-GMP phosphodiesterase TipF (flagellum assembly factor)
LYPPGGSKPRNLRKVRINVIFVAVCMVLIAASVGVVLNLAFNQYRCPRCRDSAVAMLAALMLYNSLSSRLRDRVVLGNQIAELSRGTSDLARQVMEIFRRLNEVGPTSKRS